MAHVNALQPSTIFTRIDLLYPDEHLLLQSGEVIDAAGAFSFEELAAAGEHMSNRTVDVTAEQTPVICYYVPVKQQDETAAILIGVIDCTTLPSLFKVDAYNGNAHICIADYSDGSVIADDWHDTLGNVYEMENPEQKKGYEHIDLIEEVKNAKTGVVAYESSTNGEDAYEYYTPVGIFSWELLVVVQEDVAFGNLHKIQRELYVISLAEAVMLIIYFASAFIESARLEKNKKEIERQLTLSHTLVECITTLSSHEETETALNHLLKIITEYFGSDRAYVFEINYEEQLVNNTYEYAKEGVTKEIDNLQNVPLSAVELWIEEFKKTGMFSISNLDEDVDKSSNTYQILADQNIDALIAMPLVENDVIIGFLGIDNPTKNFNNVSLISSVTYFLVDNLNKRSTQALLERLSFEDTLTRIYNRNKFNLIIEEYQRRKPASLGVAYFDLNGLKVMNDKYGHKAGDLLIKNTADCISSVFGKHSYRVGGDEFVAIIPEITEKEFGEEVKRALELLKKRDISISTGTSWRSQDTDITFQMHEADERMYENKKQYYANKKKNS